VVLAIGALGLSGCPLSTELFLGQRLEPLVPSAYVWVSGFSNAIVVRTPGGTLLVDTKMDGPAGELIAHLKEENAWPVRWVVITHAHEDHVGGLRTLLEASASPPVIWGTPILAKLDLGEHVHAQPVLQHVEVKPLGTDPTAQEIELLEFPHAHTAGDVAVWIKATGTLLTGDIFQCGYYPHAELEDGGSYLGLAQAAAELASLRPRVVVGGHGGTCSGADLDAYVAFLQATIRGEQVDPHYKSLCAGTPECAGTLERVRECVKNEQEYGPFWGIDPRLSSGARFLPSIWTNCKSPPEAAGRRGRP
jgi:glyoxylase-like metal-dependent hydrolase (beta-lactamase superfamily II)